ncbi:family 43 glycosylhydrolase [Sunxiuqinia sp. A32]|uniref:family 43 glycosylhydrolase n=1 Tax=Sunxiuqinia sp. A32 TaxID=3461496 RepID=UPI0040465FE0
MVSFSGLLTIKLGTTLICLVLVIYSQAQNPFVRNIYTADPSAHVWADGRLYVYPSHDIAPPRGCDLMDQYHVFSTDDMENWTDHGEILRAEDVDWGRSEGGFMWAPDCAFKDGTYYFYFPHPSGDEWNSTWKIGVATSSEPAANFAVQGYIEGLKSMIDPCVFVDDDGQAYFYYGGGNHCEGGKLKENMMEIDGQMQEMQGLVDFHEATWVHKRDGVYYLSYADNNSSGGNQMRYATSDHPLGPWTSLGVYIEPTGSSTDHGSIVEYKGQWYAFYHNSLLSGDDWLRSICVDSLYYNEDGTIQMVEQTREHGTAYLDQAHSIPGIIQLEDFDVGGQGIAYSDKDEQNAGNSYRESEGVDVEENSSGNYNIGFTNGGEWMEYTVNVAETANYQMQLAAASPDGNCSVHLKVDGEDVTGAISIPATGGWQTYQTFSSGSFVIEEGKHIIQFFEETGGFNADKMTFIKTGAVSSNELSNPKVDFRIYPNPATKVVQIHFPASDSGKLWIDIYSLTGLKVRSFSKMNIDRNETASIDVQGLKTGTYFLRAKLGTTNYSKKLIIP